MRTAEAKIGEVVGVIGAGLLGQLSVQILNAAGCRVIVIDPVQSRADLAARSGALAATTLEAEFRDLSLAHSGGKGLDSVLITAETPSSGPVNLASQVARDRGVVVAVGTVGMELQRKLYYEKEIDFRVSRSYGPGRYDDAYEQKGRGKSRTLSGCPHSISRAQCAGQECSPRVGDTCAMGFPSTSCKGRLIGGGKFCSKHSASSDEK